MNAPKVNYNETDLTQSPQDPPAGIMGVQALTKRGKYNNPNEVFNSWDRIQKVWGTFTGFTPDAILEIKRAVERGTKVRISRQGHYTNPLDASTLDAVLATATGGLGLTLPLLTNANTPVAVVINGGASFPVAWQGDNNRTMQAIANAIMTQYPAAVDYAMVAKTAGVGANNSYLVLNSKDAALVSAVITPSGGSAVNGAATGVNIVNSTGQTLMSFAPVDRGADYNNLLIALNTGSNGQPGYFDLTARIIGDGNTFETYQNMKLLAVSDGGQQQQAAQLNDSDIFVPTFANMLNYTPTQLDPIQNVIGFSGGSDGSAVTANDYIGGAVGVGIRSFDQYDDMIGICAIDRNATDSALAAAYASYVDRRKDCVAFIAMPNSTSALSLATTRENTNIDSSFVGFYGGHIQIEHPVSGAKVIIPSIGDVLGMCSNSQINAGPQYNFDGLNRGVLANVLKVDNNFGAKGSVDDLDVLANHQINMVINRNKKIYLTGNATAQRVLSVLSFMNVRLMLINLRKTLTPMLERYLGEPNTIPTWKKMFLEAKPVMDGLVDNESLYEYSWQGDQKANSLNDLIINTKEAVGLGKYKIKLLIRPVPGLNEIELNVILTRTSVSFEETLALV